MKQFNENWDGITRNSHTVMTEAFAINSGKWYVTNDHPKDSNVKLIYGPYDSEAHADKDESWETGGLLVRGGDLMKKIKNGKFLQLGREMKIEFVKGK